MVGLGGLEPPTSPLSGVRSNHLSYRPRRNWGRSTGRAHQSAPPGRRFSGMQVTCADARSGLGLERR